jgi:hypothetical protein
MKKYYLLKVWIESGNFKIAGIVSANSKEDAAKKLGLYPSKNIVTRLEASMGDGSFATVDLEEVGEILTHDQTRLAIAQATNHVLSATKTRQPTTWEQP